jgi:hypothetical protein
VQKRTRISVLFSSNEGFLLTSSFNNSLSKCLQLKIFHIMLVSAILLNFKWLFLLYFVP